MSYPSSYINSLTLLHSERPKLYAILAFLSAIWLIPDTKIAEFANSVELVEVAQDKSPHLDLHCLPSSL